MSAQPGYSKNESLADRMKRYESVTDLRLVPGIPVYVRLDQRAGHTFTRNLRKPFDHVYMDAMYSATKVLFEQTNPIVPYTQSDEASFVYECPEKMPFEGRLFKIQSVLASQFATAFAIGGTRTGNAVLDDSSQFASAVTYNPPSFDCRVFQMPLEECANMILWRQRDCIKNSITLAALQEFSIKELEGKDSEDKIAMLAEKGIDYGSAYLEEERLGTFVRKDAVTRRLNEYEKNLIPPDKLPQPDLFGDVWVTRNVVGKVSFGRPLDGISNRKEVLFEKKNPIFTFPSTTA